MLLDVRWLMRVLRGRKPLTAHRPALERAAAA